MLGEIYLEKKVFISLKLKSTMCINLNYGFREKSVY